jgi:sugar phosphate permease
MRSGHQPRARIYQGWWVAIGAFVATMFATIAHTSFGLFVVPTSKEFDLSRADVNNWLIAMGIGSAFLAPIAGRLIDRVSIRLIMAVGGVILALSLIGISSARSPWTTILLAVPIAFASDSAGSIAGNTATARWFRRRRGRALALVGIAASAAGFLLSPLIAFLIVSYGWRGALFIMGLLAGAVIVLMALALVRSRPREEQLRASGELDQLKTGQEERTEQQHWSYRELLTNRNFLFLAFGAGLLFASDRALVTSVAPYLSDAGTSLQMAGFLISTLTGSSIIGKLVVGYAADYVDPRRIFLVVVALHVVLLVMFIVQPGYWIMFAISAVVGVGIGGVLPTYQVLTASVFGSASYGTVIGTATVIQQVMMMAAFRFIGEARDRSGSYNIAFEVFIAIALLAAYCIWQVRISGRGSADSQPVPAQWPRGSRD